MNGQGSKADQVEALRGGVAWIKRGAAGQKAISLLHHKKQNTAFHGG
jgi:hypothetical protein